MTLKEEKQDEEITNFNNEFKDKITSNSLEYFLYKAAKLGTNLEVNKIQNSLIKDTFIDKIDFSDPVNMKYLLPLLPEFIFYCSNPDTESLDTVSPKKSIAITSLENILFKIIDNREADSIDDIIKEIVSLIFVLDEQHEGASACESAMSFVHQLLKTDIQYQVALGIRLMAVLINFRFPSENILNVLNPGKYQEPYIRINQYIAIREIFSRAGNQVEGSNTDFRKIPYEFFTMHDKFINLLDILVNKIELRNSYEKLTTYKKLIQKKEETEKQTQIKKSKSDKKIEIKKWNNIIICETDSKISNIVEFDQWVQCQFVLLFPHIYEIKKHNPKLKINDEFFMIKNLHKLSWNVQFCYLNMLRTSKELLDKSGCLLFDLFFESEFNSDFQNSLFLTIIELFQNNQKCFKNNENIESLLSYQKIQYVDPIKFINFVDHFIVKAKDSFKIINSYILNAKSENATFKAHLNYIFKSIPILTLIMSYCFSNLDDDVDQDDDDENEVEDNKPKQRKGKKKITDTKERNIKQINKIFKFMNTIPINDRPNCCRIFLKPFFISIPCNTFDKMTKRTKDYIQQSFDIAQNALRTLMNSKDDFDDRLFFINIINHFYESENDLFRKESTTFIMPLIDLIANDPVYIVRSEASQTILNLLLDSTFENVFDYIQQVFPGATLNGKKSLLSLIVSIISSIDPFESPEDKEELFVNYIDDIIDVIYNNKNKDLKRFSGDILKSIWTLLPKNTQDLLQKMGI